MNGEDLKKAARVIKDSQNIVVFTGAGASTESGIADFRSEGGLWSKYDPSVYANYYYFIQDPAPFWKMHRELEDVLEKAKPNPVHHAIAELEKMGKVKAIITQNIDMLHQKAGSGSYKGIPIYELHGTYGLLHCIRCGREYKLEEIDTRNVEYPICECSGFIKPKVVLFGESLPSHVMDEAMKACCEADCFLMVGSSLVVSPANLLPSLAKQQGAKLIFINKEETFMDDIADVVLRGKAGEIFTKLMALIKAT
ncbi:MAG: SIR2 family NAD-dependent protein deacylase [Promethearchaeota archaeon]